MALLDVEGRPDTEAAEEEEAPLHDARDLVPEVATGPTPVRFALKRWALITSATLLLSGAAVLALRATTGRRADVDGLSQKTDVSTVVTGPHTYTPQVFQTSNNYDCTVGTENWEATWTDSQKAYCCREVSFACPKDKMDPTTIWMIIGGATGVFLICVAACIGMAMQKKAAERERFRMAFLEAKDKRKERCCTCTDGLFGQNQNRGYFGSSGGSSWGSSGSSWGGSNSGWGGNNGWGGNSGWGRNNNGFFGSNNNGWGGSNGWGRNQSRW